MIELAQDMLIVKGVRVDKLSKEGIDLEAAIRRMATRSVQMAELSDSVVGEYLTTAHPTPVQEKKAKVAIEAARLAHNAIKLAREADTATLTRTNADGTSDSVTLPVAQLEQMMAALTRLETKVDSNDRRLTGLIQGGVEASVIQRDREVHGEERRKSGGNH